MLKQIFKAVIGLAAYMAVISVFSFIGHADTGHLKANRKAVGGQINTAAITGSSTAGTNFFTAISTRPDGFAFNNTSTTVWIGSVTAAATAGTVHNNISRGLPVLSSATFTLDGSLTTNLAFTCEATISTCEMRVLEGITP